MIKVLEGAATQLNAQPDHVSQQVNSIKLFSPFMDSSKTGIPLGVSPFLENRKCKSERLIDT
jgi:hypothetical protein